MGCVQETLQMNNIKRSSWNYYAGTQLTFGPRCISSLASVVHRRNAQRILVLTDSILQDAGIVGLVEQTLESLSAEVRVFSEGEIRPSTETIEKAADVAREFDADLFLGLGGGSNLDLAKTCRATVSKDCSAESILGFDRVSASTSPLVCIPTTAGSGSEVSHAAVVKNASTGKTATVLSQQIRPDIAIVDPYLTITCPSSVSAASGIDALTHAIEAYLVSNFYSFEENLNRGLPFEGNNPFGDMMAEKAISLIGKHLARAVDQPEDLAARSGMALGATLAGAAFSNCGVGLVHALEDPIGTTLKSSHGVGNGILLPEVMRQLKSERLKRLAQIGVMLDPNCTGMPDDEAADIAIDQVTKLRESVGLPAKLREIGATESQLPSLAKSAVALTLLVDLTPGSPSEEDALSILQACF